MEKLDYVDMPLRLTTEEISRLPVYSNPDDSKSQNDNQASDIAMADPKLCFSQATQLIEQRRHRDRLFGTFGRFGEPEWDILLLLYVARAELIDVSLSDACIGTMIAEASTALRYLSLMVEQDMLVSYRISTDRRLTYLRLSEKSVTFMNRHLSHLVARSA